MILVNPSIEILDNIDEEILKKIELAGRTCYKSETKITQESYKKFVQSIINSGHESVLEHEKISVRVICDRGVTHEIVRHRIASYSQESTRYCDYKGGLTFIIPCWCEINPGIYNNIDYILTTDLKEDDYNWLKAMFHVEDTYIALRNGFRFCSRWSPQQARSVLPNSLKTEIIITMNIREWRHFFNLRCSSKAHPQMQEIAFMVRNEFRKNVPILFEIGERL